ncbi:OmpA family protein [Chitinophaga polysaccharea]|uniref:OmpA family protein n=1 Tax=Chitinophaga polysaccharea TaxID=1293035 RepID=UPI0014552093|nr:OmpA family protein [Chitinophaga polysaccharea]NLR57604.1 OmpA family protein [Chitinophaga polysaccharea]
MKKLVIAVIVCSLGHSAHAQFLDRLKNKVQQKVNDKIDQTIDKATEGKKKDSAPTDKPTATTTTTAGTGSSSPVSNGEANTNTTTGITAYSRFDFVPGEKIIVEENFAQDPVGEFPGQWNTHSGAEIVTVSNRPGKWLSISQDGIFFPEYITSNLPDNFTLQADVMASNGIAGIGAFTISLLKAATAEDKFRNGNNSLVTDVPSFKVSLYPKYSGDGQLQYSSNLIGNNTLTTLPVFNVPKKNAVRVSIWRQKQRVRVYLDSTKILDLPRALDAGAVLNALTFAAYAPDYDNQGGTFYLGNIRLAVGAPDTRNKLITEGKFTTHGILFASNSDAIQPESYGALKDIAAVLAENPAVRVNIVGHTDADGSDQANLDLSKRRAAAVKTALVSNFSIDAARMETNGKGESQPVDNNSTEVGKANNRRVEFIKI